jgi:hypothetical protein
VRFSPSTAAMARLAGRTKRELVAEREDVWSRELEREWPVIRAVARLLMDGCTDVDAITAAVDDMETGELWET